jgi:hypothetical protein
MLSLIGAYQTVCGVLNALEIPAPQTSRSRRTAERSSTG